MRSQLDDPGFDPTNDEWVGAGAGWDRSLMGQSATASATATPRASHERV